MNLLTGRPAATRRLVDEFADIDDPYVVERVYAAAYGVATRSHDPGDVGSLAELVYAKVFGSGLPPANILLRDYARGVVERALFLKSPIEVDATRIRPPYESAPPVFPSDEDIAPLLPSPGHSIDKRESEDWARSHIAHSVLEDRLHRAIRETRGCSGEWLSLGLDQPIWQEPSGAGDGATDGTPVPAFDRSHIERYVLRRVFELGWTTERFGRVDRIWHDDFAGHSIRESIGRKYQWIAYREVLALMADHFQYREFPADVERSHSYQGPWQNHLRDIDPTYVATIPQGAEVSHLQGHSVGWWTAGGYDRWAESGQLNDWVVSQDDLPRVEDLLMVRNPRENTRWLNGNSYFLQKQAPSVGRLLFEEERGEVAWWMTAYLTREEDAPAFVEWASGQPFVNAGDDDVVEVRNVFVGEHGWAPAAAYRQVPGRSFGEARPSRNAPVRLEAVATKYLLPESRLDYGWLHCPNQAIVKMGGLRWSGCSADFLDPGGGLAAFDPSAQTAGPAALLLREDFVRELMHKWGVGIVWTVVCRKSVRLLDPARGYPLLRLSGAYRLSEEGLVGFMRPEVES